MKELRLAELGALAIASAPTREIAHMTLTEVGRVGHALHDASGGTFDIVLYGTTLRDALADYFDIRQIFLAVMQEATGGAS